MNDKVKNTLINKLTKLANEMEELSDIIVIGPKLEEMEEWGHDLFTMAETIRYWIETSNES